jgi:triacylglycerol lipase
MNPAQMTRRVDGGTPALRLKPLPPPSSELLFFPEHDVDYVHFEDAREHPFDRDAREYSSVNAWWLADAALLSYWDQDRARAVWSRAGLQFEFLSVQGVQCHIGYADRLVIVAFRGTQPDDWRDLMDIATIRHAPWDFGGRVHEGFLNAHRRVWPTLEQTLMRLDPSGRSTWFTGHSLGAALATLSMDRCAAARGLYTIGSPPVGDRDFARRFDNRHAGRSFRFANHRDFVVYVAAWLSVLVGNYAHVHDRRYIDGHGLISRRSPSIVDWLRLLSARALVRRLTRQLASGPHVPLPDGLIDHTPRRYAVRIWNHYAALR